MKKIRVWPEAFFFVALAVTSALLTIEASREHWVKFLASLSNDDLLVYPADNEKGVITVFTDISCPYCQILHSYIPELNQNGVTVRYLAFPRSGLDSYDARLMGNIWCASDKHDAFERALNDEKLPDVKCEKVIEQYQHATRMGVRGTPGIVYSDGHFQGGLSSAKYIIERAAAD